MLLIRVQSKNEYETVVKSTLSTAIQCKLKVLKSFRSISYNVTKSEENQIFRYIFIYFIIIV